MAELLRTKSKRNSVGTSARTPYKHALLNALLGQFVGVVSKKAVGFLNSSLEIYDLCAGNGTSIDGDRSSVEIILHHAKWAARNTKTSPACRFIERDDYAYQSLIDRHLSKDNYSFPVEFLHMDASEFSVEWDNDRNRFIHIDPNSASDMPDPGSWSKLLTRRSMVLMTLGCNACGIKRMPLEKRLPWFRYVEVMKDHIPNHFDLIFISLAGDSHQWAYLISLPSAWAESMSKVAKKKSSQILPESMHAMPFSFRRKQSLFMRSVNEHFLTKKEIEDARLKNAYLLQNL